MEIIYHEYVVPEGRNQVLCEIIVGCLGGTIATTAATAAGIAFFLERLDAGHPLEELGFVYQSAAWKRKKDRIVEDELDMRHNVFFL